MDYRITDPHLYSSITKEHSSETLLVLESGFLCFSNDILDEPLSIPSKQKERFTFASFNYLAKINSQVIDWWSMLLNQFPEAQLFLKNKYFIDPDVQAHFINKFKARGIDENRLKLMAWVDNHLQLYNEVDVALDPFPFNGHITTCEALWMGVPLITYNPPENWNDFARAGVSFLSKLGYEDWIAHSKEDYIHKAITLAKDEDLRQKLKHTLRDKMKQVGFGNPTLFMHELEQKYIDIVKDFNQKNSLE